MGGFLGGWVSKSVENGAADWPAVCAWIFNFCTSAPLLLQGGCGGTVRLAAELPP